MNTLSCCVTLIFSLPLLQDLFQRVHNLGSLQVQGLSIELEVCDSITFWQWSWLKLGLNALLLVEHFTKIIPIIVIIIAYAQNN